MPDGPGGDRSPSRRDGTQNQVCGSTNGWMCDRYEPGRRRRTGKAFLRARGWPEFAQHVMQVLTDDVLRRELESEAMRFANRLFSVEATFAELGQALADATGQKRPGVPPERGYAD